VVFHELGHEAVDGAAGGAEPLEGLGAGVILVEGPKDTFELPNDLFGAVDEAQFFA
jgi:hypothetical protein